MDELFLGIVDEGDFQHGKSEPVSKFLLDITKLVLFFLGPPHLAHAVLTGIII